MITVGITGRSGCGKSTVTACFAARGVPVADADQISRQVLQPGSPVLAQLAARFGGDILSGEGVLDRRLLAGRACALCAARRAALPLVFFPRLRRLKVVGRCPTPCHL